MALTPNIHWQWYLDKSGRLAIDLGKTLAFTTPYAENKLRVRNGQSLPFDVSHTQSYMDVVSVLERSEAAFSDAQQTQIALNAAAVLGFHKPLSLKNWLYQKSGDALVGEHFVRILGIDSESLCLVLSWEGEHALCLQLQDSLTLLNGKITEAFALHRVSREYCQAAFDHAMPLPRKWA